jgi:hypothetical protein
MLQIMRLCRAIDSGSYDWKKLDPKAEECKNNAGSGRWVFLGLDPIYTLGNKTV